MNVKQIIKDNDIKEVYSVMYGENLKSNNIDEFNDDGSFFSGGECLIFPSKEERNWDRFKPKEPTYKQCESVEQFADLFLLKTIRHKTENRIDVVVSVSELNLTIYFNNYTLLDGTPLGIKCDE